MKEQVKGTVVQIIGPVLDIRFPDGALPPLNDAIVIETDTRRITLEVAQHIGDNLVRCIAMSSTDGLTRGMEAVALGSPITVPVGKACLGRILNLLGEPIDNLPPIEGEERWSIHRPAPSFEEQESNTECWKQELKSWI